MSKPSNVKNQSVVKTLLTTFLVFSPMLIILTLGYPLVGPKGPGVSERCFAIGDLGSYFSCLLESADKLSGLELVSTIFERLNSLMLPFGYLFIVSAVLVVLVTLRAILDEKLS